MKNKKEIVIFVISVLSLSLTCFIFLFLRSKVQDNMESAKKAEIDFANEVSRRENIKNLNNYFDSLIEEKKKFETHFVQKSDVIPFLEYLENLPKSVGASGQVNAIDLADGGSGLWIDFLGSGSFESIYKLITLFENSPYEMKIYSVNLQNVANQKWEIAIKLKLVSFIGS